MSVRILDKDYQVSAPPAEQQALLNSAKLLDERMRDIRSAGRVVGVERIAVMAALNISHELLQMRGGGGQGDMLTQDRLREMSERIDQVLAKAEPASTETNPEASSESSSSDA